MRGFLRSLSLAVAVTCVFSVVCMGQAAKAQLTESEWVSIRQQMRQAQYQLTWQTKEGKDPAYRAPNREQGFDIEIAPSGFAASGKGWRFGLSLLEYGGTKLPSAVPRADLRAEKEKATCRRAESLSEWFVNTPEGVEHGLTLLAPPLPGTTSLSLTFEMKTNLKASLAADGQALVLRESKAGGAVVLRYDSLLVTDASGRRLPSRMELPAPGRLTLVVDAAGALYPVMVDPLLHSEIAILRTSDLQAMDYFGCSVSVSGDTLVVGAGLEDGGAGNPATAAGAAYVFTRNHGGADNWGEVKILHASDMQAGDEFGWSVSISGDTLVVGAYYEDGGAGDPMPSAGAAYVFTRNHGGADNWGEVKVLHASDMQSYDYFGSSVSVSGDTLAVGAYEEDGGTGDPALNAGAAYVFTRNRGGADNWGEVKVLHASDMQEVDFFGESVSVSGDTLVVGALYEDGGAGDPANNAGAAYVFARNQGGADNWGEAKILHTSDMQAGDCFGWSVSVSGDTLVVGAAYEDGGTGDPANAAGATYLFRLDEFIPTEPSGLTNNTAADLDPCGDTGVKIDWFPDPGNWNDNGVGTRTYSVLRDTTVIQSGITYGTTTYTDTGGTNFTNYLYSVRYVNGAALFADTTGVSASDNAIPGTPSSPTVTDINACALSGVTVAWPAVSGATGYDLKVGSTEILDVTSPYIHQPGDTSMHFYAVRAKNSCGTGDWSGNTPGTDSNWTPGEVIIDDITDDDPCAYGITIAFSGGLPSASYSLIRDLVEVATGIESPFHYNPMDLLEHSYQVRSYYNSCHRDSAPWIFSEVYNTPSLPTMDGFGEVDGCVQNGIKIYFTGGTPSTRHDLYKDFTLVQSNVTSPVTYDPGDTASHWYHIRTYNNTCYNQPMPSQYADEVWPPPTQPAITGITDADPCAFSGITINYNEGAPSDHHELYMDGSQVVPAMTGSPFLFAAPDTLPHTYTVRAYNHSCFTASAGVNGTDASNATVPVITGLHENTCPARTVTLTTQAGMSGYQWYQYGNPVMGGNSNTLVVHEGEDGQYTVSFTNGSGCWGLSAEHMVTIWPCPAAPPPAPDGSGGTEPVRVSKLQQDGSELRVTWDAHTCPATDYGVIWGPLLQVGSYFLQGGNCALGTSETFDWLNVDSGNIFFFVIGQDDGVESNWGTTSGGQPCNGENPSNICSSSRSNATTCP